MASPARQEHTFPSIQPHGFGSSLNEQEAGSRDYGPTFDSTMRAKFDGPVAAQIEAARNRSAWLHEGEDVGQRIHDSRTISKVIRTFKHSSSDRKPATLVRVAGCFEQQRLKKLP